MAYFTIIHWIAIISLFMLFIFFCILAFQQSNKKILISMLFSNFLVIGMLIIFSMFVIDKYTKKAILENVVQKRILLTESFTLRGQLRNIGSFDIGTCKIEVKLVNNAISSGDLAGSNVFKPTAGLDFLSSNKKNARPSTVIQEFVIAKNFRKGELKNFSVSMRYPPYFEKPYMNYKLYCH